MKRSQPEPVAQLLQQVVRGLALEERLQSHQVEPAWARAVGERVAAAARPARLIAGQLVIEARSAAWLHELSLMREELRCSINRELGSEAVREIRLRLGGGFPPLTTSSVPPRPVEPPPGSVEAAQRELSASGGELGASLVARARVLQQLRESRRS